MFNNNPSNPDALPNATSHENCFNFLQISYGFRPIGFFAVGFEGNEQPSFFSFSGMSKVSSQDSGDNASADLAEQRTAPQIIRR